MKNNPTLFTYPLLKKYFEIIEKSCSNCNISTYIIRNKKHKIVAIFPFTLEKIAITKMKSMNKLSIKDNLFGSYSFIIDPDESSHAILQMFIQYLNDHKKTWDILSIPGITTDNQTYKHLKSLVKKEFKIDETETKTLIVPITETFEMILKNMKGKERRELKRKIKRLNEKEEIRIKTITQPELIQENLKIFYQIEQDNWKGTKGTAIQQSEYKSFFNYLAETYSKLNKFRLYLLYSGEKPIAGIYGIIENQCIHFLKIGYIETYQRFSPSILLFYFAIKEIFKNNEIKNIDFFGPIAKYQMLFGSKTRTSQTITIYNKKFLSISLYLILKIIKKMKSKKFIKHILTELKEKQNFKNIIDAIEG